MQSEELSPEELSSLLGSYMPEIPGYRVIRRIGKGGMANVYQAVDTETGRHVAVKVISSAMACRPEMVERFLREAKLAAKLRHENIVSQYGAGKSHGRLFLAMELLDGVDVVGIRFRPWRRARCALTATSAARCSQNASAPKAPA